ncbi:MAG: ATP-binding protein [Corynebacterium sp.]|nr:ATP-binding protein [Corynebacterium sp.]
MVGWRLWEKRRSGQPAPPRTTTVGRFLHLAVQDAPVGIAIIDTDGNIVLSNSAAHDMSIIHGRDIHPRIWQAALEVMEDDEEREDRELDISLPRIAGKGRITDVHALVAPLSLIDSGFVVIYASDQSENVRMENARRDFVANVSHELKTPVGSMALLAEALMESTDVDYFGTRIVSEARRMGDLISELISLSKLQGAQALPELTPVGVDELIDVAMDRTCIAAEAAGIKLSRDDATGVKVLGDRESLLMALVNLITNAVNYSPDGTPVTVTQKIQGDHVHLSVTDRGIGIPEEYQDRVFERFFRVDKARSRATGGTGLGLAIVKHVVANHGGELTLWSQPGVGSTFTIILPIYQVPVAQPSDSA